ncbi:transporter substrate-binding domain-containing protein [Pseudoduganella eburnea]|uniref:Transporter substrate-binding domain-containing protein n=1 Tax=Massilia eburnea TaxID=1776165 RepID=A0A6L6QD63_9BURK|nr:transporter substrate-binding domain-containing protein [Massilia eburnea]MTW10031.1 transporter substrate-binding domain-containing protein [Massilia eburnea]
MLRTFRAPFRHLCTISLLGALCHSAAAAPAGCKRDIVVASSQVGRAMTVGADNTVRGAVRDFLDLVSERTGCRFQYAPVSRARAWMMVASGRADIMPAASQTHERDQFAQFVATHQVRPMLISLDPSQPAVGSIDELLRTRLHVAVVRSYDFGMAYRNAVGELKRQGRLHSVTDPQAVAALLESGGVHTALLPPSAFADAAELNQLAPRLQTRALPEMPHMRIGFYLSTSSLDDADRLLLQEAIRKAVASGAYADAMRRHYPRWALADVRSN